MRNTFKIAGILAIVITVGTTGFILAENGPKALNWTPIEGIHGEARVVPGNSRAATLAYDDNIPTIQMGADNAPAGFAFYGNQFNAGLPAATPRTLTSLSFFPAGIYGANNRFAIFGPVAGPTANVLFSAGASTMAQLTWNPVVLSAPLNVGSGTFLVGLYQTWWSATTSPTFPACVSHATPASWQTTCNAIAFGTGTTGGLGHHGMQIVLVGGTGGTQGTGFATIPSQNALIRVTGTNVPVELMRFDVE